MFKFIIAWIERKKRKARYEVHFGSDSIHMKDCVISPIHLVSEDVRENQEFDFYVWTKYDVYLIRLINTDSKRVTIYPAEVDGIIYIIGNLSFDKNIIVESIDEVLRNLRNEKYGFPKLKNPKCVIDFQMQ